MFQLCLQSIVLIYLEELSMHWKFEIAQQLNSVSWKSLLSMVTPAYSSVSVHLTTHAHVRTHTSTDVVSALLHNWVMVLWFLKRGCVFYGLKWMWHTVWLKRFRAIQDLQEEYSDFGCNIEHSGMCSRCS